MRLGIRTVLSLLAVAFTAYLAAGALVWTTPVEHPPVLVGAVVLYLAITWVCTFWRSAAAQAAPAAATGAEEPETPEGGPGGNTEDDSEAAGGLGTRPLLPVWGAVLALTAAVVVPFATWFAVGEASRLESFATWSIGGIGALMSIVMVRRRPWEAWIGIGLLAAGSMVWIGPLNTLALGWVGSAVWVGGAQLLSWLTERAARDTAEFTDLQRASSEWLASQDGARRVRRAQVRRALAVAGPVLARTVATGGSLDDHERVMARLAEGALRDELRGSRLLDDRVRAQLSAARERGASVTVLDEGGLEDVDVANLARIRSELTRMLRETSSERVYIRTSTHPDVAVTVVGRSAGSDGEDSVDVWQEIARRSA
jgi:hypothetical protein